MRGRNSLGTLTLPVIVLLAFWLSVAPPRLPATGEKSTAGSAGQAPGLSARPPAIEATTTRSRTVTFAYDQANRLTGQTVSGGAHILYQYDASGNLTTVTSTHSLFLPSIER